MDKMWIPGRKQTWAIYPNGYRYCTQKVTTAEEWGHEHWERRPNKGDVTSDKGTVGETEEGRVEGGHRSTTGARSQPVSSPTPPSGKRDFADATKVTNFKIPRETVLDYLGNPYLIHESLEEKNFLQM